MAKLVEWEKTVGAAANTAQPQQQLDPICGRKVSGKVPTTEYKQRKYYFCSDGCLAQFNSRTEKFRLTELAKAGALLTPGKVRWGLS
ncbi:MAG: YHS domain-containing protein [Myxococcota bacterium]|nr:YHS domain-containing protein [Myxococcota bacterium]